MPTRRTPGARVGKKRAAVKLPDTPAGDVMRLVTWQMNQRDWTVQRLYDAMLGAGSELTSPETLRKWLSGERLDGFKINHTVQLAQVFGYKDWRSFIAATARQRK